MSGTILKLVKVEMYERPNKLRIPFRFGVTTVTHGRQAIVKVRIRLENGIEGEGYAAEALAAKWFDKNLDLSESDNHHQLRKSLEIASQLYLDATPSSAFSYFSNHYEQQVAACKQLELNPLIASYGQSLIDRGIIDALCRASGTSFYDAVSSNLIGMQTNNIAPELSGFDIDGFLGGLRPSGTIDVRHTVGLSDPITDSDLSADERVDDGLPQTFEEVMATYKNQYYKIKVSGDNEEDLERIKKIASVLDRSDNNYSITLDGNEQYSEADAIADFYEKIMMDKALERFAGSILYVEQPIARSKALTTSVESLAKLVPVIIDESDGELSAFVTARKYGYSGVSSKSCKGIYKSIINKARCEIWNRQEEGRYFMSAEDLTCEPGISIQQDLALVNILGLPHVERNAHHFIDGFDSRSQLEADTFLRTHNDLYEKTNDRVRLRIRDGKFSINSLNCHGFGTTATPDLAASEPMPKAEWPKPMGDAQ
jgi:hypothetical protein